MARRKRLRWGPVLWLLVCSNILCGLAFSPITSASKVRVVGALPTDEARIRQAIQLVKGKPALRGGAEVALEEVYRRPDLRTAKWSQNLFRRGLLELAYDKPVARVKGLSGSVLTSRGQFVQTQEDVSEYPEISFFDSAMKPSAIFASCVEYVKLADICDRARRTKVANLWISVQENRAVCLNSGTAGRVALGSPDELDDKFEKLDELLASQPDILTQGKEVVLIAPSKPTVRSISTP